MLAVIGLTAGIIVAPACAHSDLLVERFVRASDDGQCIESMTYRMISEQGTAQATLIVRSALRALSYQSERQRALGCSGDIAAQAIAAGADPAVVLQATAAGL